MTGESANFKDALNSGRISTASFWLGPSLDWRSPQRSLMGFLCSNSLVVDKGFKTNLSHTTMKIWIL